MLGSDAWRGHKGGGRQGKAKGREREKLGQPFLCCVTMGDKGRVEGCLTKTGGFAWWTRAVGQKRCEFFKLGQSFRLRLKFLQLSRDKEKRARPKERSAFFLLYSFLSCPVGWEEWHATSGSSTHACTMGTIQGPRLG